MLELLNKPTNTAVAPAHEPVAARAVALQEPNGVTPLQNPGIVENTPKDPSQIQVIDQGSGIKVREFVMQNRSEDMTKRATDEAQRQFAAEFQAAGFFRRVRLRAFETYYVRRNAERLRTAMVANDNSFLTMNVAQEVAAARGRAGAPGVGDSINRDNNRAQYQAEGRTSVELARMQYSKLLHGNAETAEARSVIDARGVVKNGIMHHVINRVDQTTTVEQMRQYMQEFTRDFVNHYSRLPQTDPNHPSRNNDVRDFIERFGPDAHHDLQGIAHGSADVFAAPEEFLQLAKEVQKDMHAHHLSLDDMDQYVKIILSSPRWAQATDTQITWRDRFIQGTQRISVNPEIAAVLASVGGIALTAASRREVKTVAQIITNSTFVGWAAGTAVGTAIAAMRRNYEVKRDITAHRTAAVYDRQITPPIPAAARESGLRGVIQRRAEAGEQARRERLNRTIYDMASVDQMINGGGDQIIYHEGERAPHQRRSIQDLIQNGGIPNEDLALRAAEIITRLDFYTHGIPNQRVGATEVNGRGALHRRDVIHWGEPGTERAGERVLEEQITRLRGALEARVGRDAAADLIDRSVAEWRINLAQDIAVKDRNARNHQAIESGYAAGYALLGSATFGLVTYEALQGLNAVVHAAAPGVEQAWNGLTGHGEHAAAVAKKVVPLGSGEQTINVPGTTTVTNIPENAAWVKDVNNVNLVDKNHPDHILMKNVQFDNNGHMTGYDHTQYSNLIDVGQDKIAKGVQINPKEWFENHTKGVDGWEWYGNDTPEFDKNELLLDNHITESGTGVTFSMTSMQDSWQHGNYPNPEHVPSLIKDEKAVFSFWTKPNDEHPLLFKADHGQLTLDKNDWTGKVWMCDNPKTDHWIPVPNAIAANMVLGDLSGFTEASELNNQQQILNFNVSAGGIFHQPDGSTKFGSFASIHGIPGRIPEKIDIPPQHVTVITPKEVPVPVSPTTFVPTEPGDIPVYVPPFVAGPRHINEYENEKKITPVPPKKEPPVQSTDKRLTTATPTNVLPLEPTDTRLVPKGPPVIIPNPNLGKTVVTEETPDDLPALAPVKEPEDNSPKGLPRPALGRVTVTEEEPEDIPALAPAPTPSPDDLNAAIPMPAAEKDRKPAPEPDNDVAVMLQSILTVEGISYTGKDLQDIMHTLNNLKSIRNKHQLINDLRTEILFEKNEGRAVDIKLIYDSFDQLRQGEGIATVLGIDPAALNRVDMLALFNINAQLSKRDKDKYLAAYSKYNSSMNITDYLNQLLKDLKKP